MAVVSGVRCSVVAVALVGVRVPAVVVSVGVSLNCAVPVIAGVLIAPVGVRVAAGAADSTTIVTLPVQLMLLGSVAGTGPQRTW